MAGVPAETLFYTHETLLNLQAEGPLCYNFSLNIQFDIVNFFCLLFVVLQVRNVFFFRFAKLQSQEFIYLFFLVSLQMYEVTS